MIKIVEKIIERRVRSGLAHGIRSVNPFFWGICVQQGSSCDENQESGHTKKLGQVHSSTALGDLLDPNMAFYYSQNILLFELSMD